MDSSRLNRALVLGGFLCLAVAGMLVLNAWDRPRPTAPTPSAPWASAAPEAPDALVAIVFHLRDCGGSIERLTAWNALERGEGLPVRGFLLDGPAEPAAIRAALAGSGIEFPLERGDARFFGPLLRALGHRETPVALLLDRRRRVRMTVPLDSAFRPADVQALLAVARSGRAAPAGGAR